MTDPTEAKALPHSIESEEGLLSSIFMDGIQSLMKIMDNHITADSFHLVVNQQIFKGFLWLHKNKMDLSLEVFCSEMGKLKKIEMVGGMTYLVQVTEKIPTTAQLSYFIERVRETYVLRQLIHAAQNTIALAHGQNIAVEDFTAEVNKILSIRHATYTVKTLAQAAEDTISQAQRIQAGTATEEDLGLSWAWKEFDDKFGPKLPGQLIILAARPSVGKSSLARQDCLHVAKKHGETALFSREMPINELPPLFAQQLCGVSWKDFRKRTLLTDDEKRFIDTLGELKRLTRFSVFDKDRSLVQMSARIRAYSQIKALKYLVVDYLQRFDPDQQKGETRDVALGRMSMAFKDLAVDLKIPVLLLCQVGRDLEKDNRDPRLSDLRESGNLEQDADRVIFLTAPAVNKQTNTAQDIYSDHAKTLYVEAIQAKGRGEGRARCGLTFHRPTTTFRPLVEVKPKQAVMPLNHNNHDPEF